MPLALRASLTLAAALLAAATAPGFAADCLETLEELAIRGQRQFLAAGGESFAYVPSLNDSVLGIEMLENVIGQQLEGWIKRA